MPSICKPTNSDKEIFVNYPNDIIDTIKDPKIKRVTQEFVKILAKSIATHISAGDWTSIPFIGNVRISKMEQELATVARKQQIEDAKATMSKEEYGRFRKELAKDIDKTIRERRLYKYVVSMRIKNNKKLYKRLCSTKGVLIANFILYSLDKMTVVSNTECYEFDDR